VVDRLAILNVPHPRRLVLEGFRRPRQLAKSWYMFAFQPPHLGEWLCRARGWSLFTRWAFHGARPGAFTDEDIERYIEAWSQPGALTAMINYYRAALRQTPGQLERRLRPIQAPTLVIWGERDRFLSSELAEPHRADVPNLEGVVRLDASHWVQDDQPERVSQLLIDFLRPGTG
jgi:pimeloyl-ACP methyl ester carboxylesterase